MNKWWGYRHVNGDIQVKRFFGDRDIEEARESGFVAATCGPFMAKDRQGALGVAEERLAK